MQKYSSILLISMLALSYTGCHAQTCTGTVAPTARTGAGSFWMSNDLAFQIYDIIVTNTGLCAITGALMNQGIRYANFSTIWNWNVTTRKIDIGVTSSGSVDEAGGFILSYNPQTLPVFYQLGNHTIDCAGCNSTKNTSAPTTGPAAPLGTNVLLNPGFDDAYSHRIVIPSWSQFNSSAPVHIDAQYDWVQQSQPYCLRMGVENGLQGAVQTVVLNQTSAHTLNLTTWVWVQACSQGYCQYSAALGVELDLVYADGTTDKQTQDYYTGDSENYIPHTLTFTPPKPVLRATVKLLFNAGESPAYREPLQVFAVWDDISLIQTA